MLVLTVAIAERGQVKRLGDSVQVKLEGPSDVDFSRMQEVQVEINLVEFVAASDERERVDLHPVRALGRPLAHQARHNDAVNLEGGGAEPLKD